MASLLTLAGSSLDAGCVHWATSSPARRDARRPAAALRPLASRQPNEFLGRGESSAQLCAAAAAGPCRRARLGTAGSGHLTVRAGLGDYAATTAAAYGATLLLGGAFAFVRTGSKGSLGGGLTGALLYGTAYYLLQSASTESLGNALGFGTGLLFSAVFAIRLFATGKPVPAGPLLALSALATVVFASAYFG